MHRLEARDDLVQRKHLSYDQDKVDWSHTSSLGELGGAWAVVACLNLARSDKRCHPTLAQNKSFLTSLNRL